jgi:hypothetical protein
VRRRRADTADVRPYDQPGARRSLNEGQLVLRSIALTGPSKERSEDVSNRSPLSPSGRSPVTVVGRLDTPLRRWSWLYKWFLAIPHLIVVAALWVVFVVLTVVAGVSIVFTGRYPKGIFEFNVGVLRWTWRVQFYAFTFGTDRYPPFTLRPVAGYPAQLTIEYPQRLSRGLVWVKWWLLAIPHYFVVSFFSGGSGVHLAGGLIGVLCLIAAIHLAIGRPYPTEIFDFVMGMHRWSWRVVAYAALLRDEYPPFRLDNGPNEAGAPTATVSP